MRLTIFAATCLALFPLVTACSRPKAPTTNPLLTEWKTPFGVPPFGQIKPDDFMPAFEEAIRQHNAQVADIVEDTNPPAFDNTVAALDDSGEALARVNSVFGLLTGAETNDRLQAIEAKVEPMLAAHNDDIYLNESLFKRVKAVYDGRDSLRLGTEQATLLRNVYRRFVRGGANLAPAEKDRLRDINRELSTLIVKFSNNLLEQTNAYKLVLDSKDQLAGLPGDQIEAAAAVASEAGLPGKWVFTLKAPSIWPFLQRSSNRDLRRQILTAYANRCDKTGETDNTVVFATIAKLRVEKAQLLGYKTWANFILDEYMAKNPENVYQLLEQLWKPALARAKQEAADMQAMIDREKGGFNLEPWDWRYYSERVKRAKYDLDDEAIKPYLPIDEVREGAFTLANRLYGITLAELTNIPVYNPEVKAFEVREKDGKFIGILYLDFYPRPGKRGGAWCSTIRDQYIKEGQFVTPIVYSVFNFTRPTGDTPALLTRDEAETLFHEFGHALHSLFSDCRFRGSSYYIAQDFVELPSQVMENWVFEPQLLKLYARHYKTGEVMPDALVARIRKAMTFNQGFEMTEYLAASFLDMDWHTMTGQKLEDADAFEKASMARWGLIPQILPRYRTPYFAHAADEYSAGYYSYTWSAVLDSDAFLAFKEKGDLFDPESAAAFRHLLSKSGGEDPAVLFRQFRGRDPKVDALLIKRGLLRK
ncbi:MAG: peptidyl-dipeptidase Dcp [Acidobacteria bacterium]|nr:peptidyl-dipeptidase Dcp [Acidobacteriota bacterium]